MKLNLKPKEMKTFDITAHYSHSVHFIVKAENSKEAKKIIESRGFDTPDKNYKWFDGNYEELLNMEEPEEINSQYEDFYL